MILALGARGRGFESPLAPFFLFIFFLSSLSKNQNINSRKKVTDVGFEPTPPKRLVPKTSALDHSANQSYTSQQSLFPKYGGLAQSVECVVRNDEAAGSKPAFSIFWKSNQIH